jgi:hypothetical protein
MKTKGLMVISLLILFIFPLISAVEFNVNDNYKQGETMIAKVSGNFINPLVKENILFYQGHVRIPFEYGVAQLNGDYYIYALLLGKAQGNYSISLENIKYLIGAEVVSNNIIKNFTITNETADFSLKPGFIATPSDFSLKVQNLKDNQITINVKTPPANGSSRNVFVSSQDLHQDSFSLRSGEVKDINFLLGDGLPGFSKIELTSNNLDYKVPVSVYSSSVQSSADIFKIEPLELILSIPTNTITKRTVYLYNIGNTAITNITLSLSDSISSFVNISQAQISNLEAKSNIPIGLTILSPGEADITGSLKAMQGGDISYSQITLKFLNNYIPPNETATTPYTNQNCVDIPGTIYDTVTERCDAETVYAKDNVCCLGNVTKIQANSNSWTGRIIAISIFVLIGVVILWFYFKKFKKAKKPVDLLEIAKPKKD